MSQCASRFTCFQCTQLPQCGWCSAANACIPGDAQGAYLVSTVFNSQNYVNCMGGSSWFKNTCPPGKPPPPPCPAPPHSLPSPCMFRNDPTDDSLAPCDSLQSPAPTSTPAPSARPRAVAGALRCLEALVARALRATLLERSADLKIAPLRWPDTGTQHSLKCVQVRL
jgi:hypothetical protein